MGDTDAALRFVCFSGRVFDRDGASAVVRDDRRIHARDERRRSLQSKSIAVDRLIAAGISPGSVRH